MVGEKQKDRSGEAFWQRLILPEEDRRCLSSPPAWNGSYRWFRSANVVDLWDHRSAEEKQRIIEFMWRQQLRNSWRGQHEDAA
jgi:hypothetical protein